MKAQIIIAYQIALVLFVVVVMQVLHLQQEGLSAVLYGGFISVMASVVMVARLNQGLKKLQNGNQRGSLYIYLGVIERLFVAIMLFSAGFIWLKLSPAYTVVGLITGQVGFMIGGFRVKD